MSKGKRMTLQDAQNILALYDEYHELKGRYNELRGRIKELKPPPTKHNRKRALEIIEEAREWAKIQMALPYTNNADDSAEDIEDGYNYEED